jgi:hypothetical protein
MPVTKKARTYQVGGDHYARQRVQPWDVIDTWPPEQALGFYRGNALKYIMRMGEKGSAIEDAQKAAHYLAKIIEILEKRARRDRPIPVPPDVDYEDYE